MQNNVFKAHRSEKRAWSSVEAQLGSSSTRNGSSPVCNDINSTLSTVTETLQKEVAALTE